MLHLTDQMHTVYRSSQNNAVLFSSQQRGKVLLNTRLKRETSVASLADKRIGFGLKLFFH